MNGGGSRGLLCPLLLLLLHERPGHGYDLVERLTGLGLPDVEPGQVYRTLRGLERQGMLTSEWVTSETGPPRRHYELTQRGLAWLHQAMDGLAELALVLDGCLTKWAEAPGAVQLNGSAAAAPWRG